MYGGQVMRRFAAVLRNIEGALERRAPADKQDFYHFIDPFKMLCFAPIYQVLRCHEFYIKKWQMANPCKK